MRRLHEHDCWVIIPAMNEGRKIHEVVLQTRKQGFKNIVVVDDGSYDTTAEHAKPATVLRHVVNLGKGAAMKTGAEYAIGRGAKAFMFVDGDGQHNPAELPKFLEELNRKRQVVFGARKEKKNMPLERRLGSWILRTVIRYVYNIRLHDPLCGYRAMTRKAYKSLEWESRDYGVESEIIARAGKACLSYSEVEVQTIYHNRYKGMTIMDGLRIVLQLIWWRMTH